MQVGAANTKRLLNYARFHLNAVIMVIATVVLSVTFLYCIGYSPPRDDVLNFYAHAEAMKAGLIPYLDFDFEFPPFSLVFFLIPGLFTSDLDTYAALFGAEMVLFTLLALYYVLRIRERIHVNSAFVAGVFVILMLIYFTDMMKKFDVIPMALSIAAIYYFIERRFGIAYALSMAGAMVKIYPALILTLFLIVNAVERVPRHRNSILKGIAACIIVGLVSVVPLIALSVSFSDIVSFITFHTNRGFQVESFPGVLIQLFGLMGLTIFCIEPAHYTWDVTGPLGDILVQHWNIIYMLAIIAVLVLSAHYILRERDLDGRGWNPRSLIVMSAAVILVFMLTNKVFSTQYMIWIFPFLAMLPFFARDWRLSVVLAALFVTTECCARGILFHDPGEPMFVLFNLVRDTVLLLILVSAVRGLIGDGGVVTRHFAVRNEGPRSSL